MKIVENKNKRSCIYLRYYNNELYYIGESVNELNGRPYRNVEDNPWDRCRILKAPVDSKRRKYWEAWLIVRLEPRKQNKPESLRKYSTIISKSSGIKQDVISKEEAEIRDWKYLEKLRCKNNKERAIYWYMQAKHSIDRILFYKKHIKTSINCMQHYLDDAKRARREKQYENNT